MYSRYWFDPLRVAIGATAVEGVESVMLGNVIELAR